MCVCLFICMIPMLNDYDNTSSQPSSPYHEFLKNQVHLVSLDLWFSHAIKMKVDPHQKSTSSPFCNLSISKGIQNIPTLFEHT